MFVSIHGDFLGIIPNHKEAIVFQPEKETVMANWFVAAFDDVKNEADKLFKKAPSEIDMILADIQIVAPVIESIIDGVDPAVAPVVSAVVSIAQAGLATLSATIKKAGATPTALTITSAVQANLSAILQVSQVKSSASIAKITAGVDQAQSWMVAIANALTALQAAPATVATPVVSPVV